jgi:hypothetical protein
MHLVPAQASHLLDLLGQANRLTMPAFLYRLQLLQLVTGRAFTAMAAGPAPVAMVGVHTADGKPGDCWFRAAPSLGKHLVGFARLVRPELRAELTAQPHGIICHVLPGAVAGERLAAVMGFADTGDMFGTHRIWKLEDR